MLQENVIIKTYCVDILLQILKNGKFYCYVFDIYALLITKTKMKVTFYTLNEIRMTYNALTEFDVSLVYITKLEGDI